MASENLAAKPPWSACGSTQLSHAEAWLDVLRPEGDPFSGVQSNLYWSSSTRAGYPGDAWYVYVAFGSVNDDGKTRPLYVWPVRGGQ